MENFLKNHENSKMIVENIQKSLKISEEIVENFQHEFMGLGKSCGKLSKKSDNSHKWCGQIVEISNMYIIRGSQA
ncbi:hypothetical protein [Oceanirhabdus sp. W0125-5]|uniref:hypothetical protein n=1 Tax=Oceanirhabdus sp. W0125-5 TaxID=2999116 RepID=UPI0022F31542|nr:hypothetical protein [Oceanirhabdus sp. W0125-5]WBW96874.1 hypothetical protein OW730_24765 [Oceanirhabdus sp. W0125-5]